MTLIYLLFACGFGLYAWQEFKQAILLLIVLLPTYLLRFDVFGVPTTVLELLLLVVIGIGIVRYKFYQPKHYVHLKPVFLPVALLLLAATIGLFVSPNLFSALGVYKAYFIEPTVFGLLLFVLLSHKHLSPNELMKALGASAVLVSAIGIIQWFIPSGIPIPWDFERRITSVFDFPNAVGLYLAPIVTLAWIHLKQDRRWLIVSVLGTIAIVLAQSEAAIVAVVASIFLFLLIQKQTRKTTFLVGIALTVFVSLSPWRDTVVQKLTLQDYSGQVRVSQWNETWDMLQDRPFFGAGLSGYTQTLAPYHQAKQYEIFQYPHNLFLNTWTELGLLGLMGFLLLCTTVLQRFLSTLTDNRTILFSFFPLLTMFIHGLVDVPFFKNDLSVLTVIFLILFLYDTQTKQTN